MMAPRLPCGGDGLASRELQICWRLREKGKSGRLQPTPAMQAGLTDTLWSFENLYDNVMAFDRDRKTMAKYRKLADRLKRKD